MNINMDEEAIINEKIKKLRDIQKEYNESVHSHLRDADTLLYDAVENADFEISGIANEALEIWEKTNDKKAVDRIFYLFTDMYITNFLDMAIEVMEGENK